MANANADVPVMDTVIKLWMYFSSEERRQIFEKPVTLAQNASKT